MCFARPPVRPRIHAHVVRSFQPSDIVGYTQEFGIVPPGSFVWMAEPTSSSSRAGQHPSDQQQARLNIGHFLEASKPADDKECRNRREKPFHYSKEPSHNCVDIPPVVKAPQAELAFILHFSQRALPTLFFSPSIRRNPLPSNKFERARTPQTSKGFPNPPEHIVKLANHHPRAQSTSGMASPAHRPR